MKKYLVILLAGLVLISLVACGDDTAGGEKDGAFQGENNTDVIYTEGGGKAWGQNDTVTPYFPPVDESKIISTLSNAKSNYMIYMDWTLEEAQAYLEECKEAGYTYEWINSTRTDSSGKEIYSWNYSYGVSNIQVKLNNETDDGSWSLVLMK